MSLAELATNLLCLLVPSATNRVDSSAVEEVTSSESNMVSNGWIALFMVTKWECWGVTSKDLVAWEHQLSVKH